ncbi:MAG: hypothetical protein COA82_08235 [Alkaliphilus sp.]|nr:MAG: hypothetical protein COA82_08235 [Alkaliphilus sp.]
MDTALSLTDLNCLLKHVENFGGLKDEYVLELNSININEYLVKGITGYTSFLEDKQNLETKIELLKSILSSYEEKIKNAAEKGITEFTISNSIPSWKEYNSKLTFEEIRETLHSIIGDYARLSQKYAIKDLAIIFSISEKMVSVNLLKKEIRSRSRIDLATHDLIFKLYSDGLTLSETAKKLDISYSTISNYFSDFKNRETIRNSKNNINITHNEAIERLVRTIPQDENITIYSEHLAEYSSNSILEATGYKEIFEYADLVVFFKDKPIIYVEVEIKNDISKSLANLNARYPESRYKALFVVANKLNDATRIRNDYKNSFGIHAYKLAVGFTDDFKSDIRKIIKDCNNNS